MKRKCLISILLIATFLLLFAENAYADGIAEPSNDFFSRHRSDCVSLDRCFYANSEEGFVSLKIAPDANREVDVCENGGILHISFTYNRNGELWGFVTKFSNTAYEEVFLNAWVQMGQLLLVYDFISFAEDHGDDIHQFSGSLDLLEKVNEVVFWKWPGSGLYHTILGQPYKSNVFGEADLLFTRSYVDADGREWGFFTSKYWQNIWVCLSDPSNPDVPAFNPAPTPELWQPGERHSEIPGGLPLTVLTIILVAVLVVGTTMLVTVLWKRETN